MVYGGLVETYSNKVSKKHEQIFQKAISNNTLACYETICLQGRCIKTIHFKVFLLLLKS